MSPGHALHGEILVHRADEQIRRIDAYVVVEVVRNRAAVGERRQSGPAPPAQAPADQVLVQVGGAAPASGGEPVGQHGHHGVELRSVEAPVGPSAAEGGEQVVAGPLAGAHLGDDLLREHVQGLFRYHDAVQFPLLGGGEQGAALDQFVAAQRKQAPLGGAEM